MKTDSNKQLNYQEIDSSNWPLFEEKILLAEEIFDDALKTSVEDYRMISQKKGFFGLIAYEKEEYIGNALIYELTDEDIDYLRIKEIVQLHSQKYAYLENIVILPNFYGRNYGITLLKELLKRLAAKNYDIFCGHFKKNSSLFLMQKLNAVCKKEYTDWFDAKESFVYAELSLKDISLCL